LKALLWQPAQSGLYPADFQTITSLFVVWQLTHLTPPACGLNAGERCLYAVKGTHAVVRWHASQDRVLTKWPEGLPFALAPLWQVAHVFGATPVCANVAGIHAVER
jgi:hypothetical protein